MKPIKIKFTDFWPGFKPDDNYFYNLLGKYFNIQLSNNPEILIFSCYGIEHLEYKCHKVQYLAENIRPDFRITDYSISFDYLKDNRHIRLPLYVMYFDKEYTMEKLLTLKSDHELDAIIKGKKEFCCFVASNSRGKERNAFFQKLAKYKRVDSGGGYLNNIGGRVVNKLEFIKQYKFTIAFENSSFPGYTTEKVLQPFHVNTIPIYWGNPEIGKEMNTQSFFNYHDYNSYEALIEKIIEADKNENIYKQYLKQPLFKGNEPNEYFDEKRIVDFFENIIISSVSAPISLTAGFARTKSEIKFLTYLEILKNKAKSRIEKFRK